MGQTPEKSLGRPKLRNVAIPVQAICCLFCGKHKDECKDDFNSIVTRGLIYFACPEHLDSAKQLLAEMRAMIRPNTEEKSTTE
jgi:hypothetical protein